MRFFERRSFTQFPHGWKPKRAFFGFDHFERFDMLLDGMSENHSKATTFPPEKHIVDEGTQNLVKISLISIDAGDQRTIIPGISFKYKIFVPRTNNIKNDLFAWQNKPTLVCLF